MDCCFACEVDRGATDGRLRFRSGPWGGEDEGERAPAGRDDEEGGRIGAPSISSRRSVDSKLECLELHSTRR